MKDITTSGAAPGIYALWVKGQAGSPYLTTKHEPLAIMVGSVSRDFGISSDVTTQTVTSGAPAVFRIAVKDAQTLAIRRIGGAQPRRPQQPAAGRRDRVVLSGDGDAAGQEVEALLVDPHRRDDRPRQRDASLHRPGDRR